MPQTYTPIRSTTLTSAAASVVFGAFNGPSFDGYTDIVLVCQTSVASGTLQNYLQFNEDTGSNYSTTILTGNGTTATSLRWSNEAQIRLGYDDYNTTAIGQMTIVHIQNYANTTTNKTTIQRGSNANNGVSAGVGLWRSTAAITSITIKPSGAVNYAAGSTFTLYGVKSA